MTKLPKGKPLNAKKFLKGVKDFNKKREERESKQWKKEVVVKFTGGRNSIGDFDNRCVDWNSPRHLTMSLDELKQWFANYLTQVLTEVVEPLLAKERQEGYDAGLSKNLEISKAYSLKND